jgi:anti-sigma regulatory factor (Ser/Thr protein kinase)
VVAGELIANAVLHAPGPIRIDVDRLGRDVRIAVTDTGRDAAPRPGVAPEATATRGRGLLIIAALSTGWGWTADDAAGTKTVHATVACGHSSDIPRTKADA